MPKIRFRIVCSRRSPVRSPGIGSRTLSILVPFALPLMLACGAEGFKPPEPPDPSQLYWELALNHHAVTLSLGVRYDTLTLVAVPRTASGTPIEGLPAPVYASRDISKIAVTPDGVLHAVGVTEVPVWVVATVVSSNIKHVDSVRVRVVDVADPPVLASFSVQPIPPDSAKIGVALPEFGLTNFMPPLAVHAADNSGEPISDLIVAFRSSNNSVATIDQATGAINPVLPGHVTFYASTTAFGVSKADSVLYQVGAPIISIIPPSYVSDTSQALYFPTAVVGVGALVIWTAQGTFANPVGYSLEFKEADLPNVVSVAAFSESARITSRLGFLCSYTGDNCTGVGNVVIAPPSVWAVRVFTAPGIYEYRCTPCANGGGRIIVADEAAS